MFGCRRGGSDEGKWEAVQQETFRMCETAVTRWGIPQNGWSRKGSVVGARGACKGRDGKRFLHRVV